MDTSVHLPSRIPFHTHCMWTRRLPSPRVLQIVPCIPEIFIISTASMVRRTNFLTSCNKCHCPVALDLVGSRGNLPGKILIHVYLSDGPTAAPCIAQSPHCQISHWAQDPQPPEEQEAEVLTVLKSQATQSFAIPMSSYLWKYGWCVPGPA